VIEALPREGAIFALETARAAGVVAIAPVLGQDAPMRQRAALVLLLAFLAHSAGARIPEHIEELGNLMVAVPSEVVIGVGMGFLVRCAFAVVEIAGDLMSPMLGFGAAGLFDPHTAVGESGLSRMLRLFAMLLAFILGLHRVVIASLLGSYRILPPGSTVDIPRAVGPIVQITSHMVEAGLRLALPILAVLLMVQVALAFISRAAPSMQIFSVGFAFSLVTGWFALLVALPDLAHETLAQFSMVGRNIEALLVALGA
jgi:flagellar biosynthetic protein FliR